VEPATSVPPNPYGSLDPRSSEHAGEPLVEEASWPVVLVRGARKRCPRCGERRIWHGWFALKLRCPRCDLRFEGELGGFLGAMTLNYAVAFVIWGIMVGIWLAITVPDVPVAPMMAASAVVLVAAPLWFFPRSKTIWAAIEFLVRRSEPDYRRPVRRDPRARDLE
jgi:uncharacterized protein (DUF983 family)